MHGEESISKPSFIHTYIFAECPRSGDGEMSLRCFSQTATCHLYIGLGANSLHSSRLMLNAKKGSCEYLIQSLWFDSDKGIKLVV